jgi:hypothetical protein
MRVQFDHFHFDVVSVMHPDAYTAICQCPLCAEKDSPERKNRGLLSDHVWDFVNRVAKEVAKTHQDKKIINCAYGVYASDSNKSRPRKSVATRAVAEAIAPSDPRTI